MSAPAVWQVPSATRPGLVHSVTLHADGLLSCSCEASQYGRLCRHRISVIHDHLQEMMTMAFDPNDHLINMESNPNKPPRWYLEVRWRLVWLREVHPDAVITTEILEHHAKEEWAVIKATVTIPGGGGSATGMALQRPTSIAKDYIANGETSAVGRALAGLGFGTQHATELDQGAQVVDSPVSRPVGAITALTPANLQQRAWYREAMKRYGFADEDDRLAIAEDIGRAPFDHLTAPQLKGIVDAARATLVAKGEDGRWTIVEPVVERSADVAIGVV